MNRRYACSSPNSTTEKPYSMICGANATIMSVVVSSMRRAGAGGVRVDRDEQVGDRPRGRGDAAVTGSRISTDQVSSAEETCVTCAFWPRRPIGRAADRASTGTIALASAPPMASS